MSQTASSPSLQCGDGSTPTWSGLRASLARNIVRGLLAALLVLASSDRRAFAQSEEDEEETPDVPGPETKTVDSKAKAADLVNQGNMLFEKGNVQGALQKYQEAYKAYASPKILFNIAEAKNELGQSGEAETDYEKFLNESNLDPSSPIMLKAKERLRALQSKLSYVEFESDVSGAEVSIDGKVVGSIPLEQVRVSPGKHKVVVTMPGYETFEQEVEAEQGRTASVEVEMKLAEVTSKPSSQEPLATTSERRRSSSDDSVTSKWWFWTALGAAAVVAGAVVVVAAGSGGSDFVPSGELGSSSTSEWTRF